MKIYTRTGDGGETSLFGGGRVAKDHARVDAYGTVDELNAFLGVALASGLSAETAERLRPFQDDLFSIGAVLATAPPDESRPVPSTPDLPEERIVQMESWMDAADTELPPLREFVVPGGSPAAASLHVARTVCRRAERAVVELARSEPVDSLVIRYLNRLSDLLFVLARLENHRAGAGDSRWRKPGPEGGRADSTTESGSS